MPVSLRISWCALLGLVACSPPPANEPEWTPIFNGRDLDGWLVKIAGHELGDNFANTFRVEDGLIKVRYDGYGDFDDQFGHLFYDGVFSHYRLRVEYRFVGEQQPGGPGWAERNSGIMFHSQDPRTLTAGQDFPISVEAQFLGGHGRGQSRPTMNVCTPGTNVVINGRIEPRHCVDSTSDTYHGDQWVTAEIIVMGDSLAIHLVNGDTVLQYSGMSVGGGSVNGHDPAVKIDGAPLGSGFFALQSESHPMDFRRVELLNLSGCMDQTSTKFREYFVISDPAACR